MTETGKPLDATPEALLDGWLAAKAGSPRTRDAYRRDVLCFLEHAARAGASDGPALAALGADDFRGFAEAMERAGATPATVARRLSALRGFYGHIRACGLLADPTLGGIGGPAVPRRPAPAIAPGAGQRALSLVGLMSDEPWVGKRDRAVLSLMLLAGLKIGEVLALSRADFSRDGPPTLRLDGGARGLRLPPAAAEALADYLRACPRDLRAGEPLFVGERGGPLNPGVVQRQMRRLRAHLGLPPGTTPHALRQAFARELLASGTGIDRLQAELGLAHRATSRRYR
ncbi:tyrosine-type recombinase/integrase [Azospirillum sp. SYSU D00513]|uniref:tyrosine-type recombinase/integrase n=1 Tax=Azospirillum sp. SYSU D00513 TaxID=2812561 RepID=UPI001A969A59